MMIMIRGISQTHYLLDLQLMVKHMQIGEQNLLREQEKSEKSHSIYIFKEIQIINRTLTNLQTKGCHLNIKENTMKSLQRT